MAIRWAHPRLLASNALGWTAIRWVRTTSPANIYPTRGDGHTVGSSQTPCNMRQGWMAIWWAHPKYFGWMAIRWAHPKYVATSEQAWMAIRWAHPRFLAKQRTRVDGHTVGTFKSLAIYLTSGDGHTVGSSQTHCNLKQGWMATRWAHPTYFATFDQGWMAIRWAHLRFLAKQFTGVDGHTVGTSQIACESIYKVGWPYGGHIPITLYL
jgi:hypothetical protein